MPRFPDNPTVRPAVVTGASSGIGRATAETLAAAGHPVVLGARRQEVLDEVVAGIEANGGTATALPLDLGDPDSVSSFAQGALDVLGEVEILVSNAAQNAVGAVMDLEDVDLGAMLEVNVQGTHRLIRELLPGLIERQRGDVVFVTSDVVERPRPSMAAYVTSKWGLEGYVRSLQMELEGTGVRATILRPGPTLTGMGMDWDPEATAEVLDEWTKWGFTRHANFMRPAGVAAAICAVVALPRGVHASVVELQPEAPLDPGRLPEQGAPS